MDKVQNEIPGDPGQANGSLAPAGSEGTPRNSSPEAESSQNLPPEAIKAEKEAKKREKKPVREAKGDKKSNQPTKIVVRRLPATMKESEFLDQVSPIPDYNYFYFVEADMSLEPHAFSSRHQRLWAYINFNNMEDVMLFRDRFDGYVFVDARGQEYPAVVEFAPYQKVPIPQQQLLKKKDPKIGTLDNDPEFLSFVEAYENEEKVAHPTLDQHLEEIDIKQKEKASLEHQSTPLLEFIKEKKKEKMRIREEKREAKRRKEDKREDKQKQKKNENKQKGSEDKSGVTSGSFPEGKNKNEKFRNENQKTQRLHEEKEQEKLEMRKERERKRNETRKLKQRENKLKGKKEPNTEIGGTSSSSAKDVKKILRRNHTKEDIPHKSGGKGDEKPIKKESIPSKKQPSSALATSTVTSEMPKDISSKKETIPADTGMKPKRYSDRRKEERLKRAMAKQQTSVEEISEEKQIHSVTENLSQLSVSVGDKKSERTPSNESIPIDERKAKFDKERRERVKNKERPTMEIYRPGKGKFSSQTLNKDSGDQLPGGEQHENQSSKQNKRGRVFYNKNRANRNRETPESTK